MLATARVIEGSLFRGQYIPYNETPTKVRNNMTEIDNEIEEQPSEDSTSLPRTIADHVVKGSVRFIITSTIAALVPTETKTEKVKVVVGSYMIASMVGDKAVEHIDVKIANFKESLADIKKARAYLASLSENEIDNPTP